jgi:hypothetical protein
MRNWPKPFRISLHHVEGSCLSITLVVKMASFGDIETYLVEHIRGAFGVGQKWYLPLTKQ